ncbi:AMP-dependent synthetase [Paractinoplanes abujensis]|uniref:Long-chain acyl-CoA synthetase n=1 Tax=Paractinoplanes abujensis TaxID=882441 RepID=A0A7W7G5Q9_9ACTN|nr:long-chain fatty acid--CoA ligase [Actinoplanes abujensis]MBB4696819.1 long-chain acyl-CoA synthetase [Actinoplanes abujensis]GID18716.1 AMP-dependent synthetase [Actinoplanes abujensis]
MTQLSLATVLAESARKYPDKIAVIDSLTTERITYRDLWQQTLAYAGGLQSLGIGPGDVVAIQIPNLADFPRVYYAVLAAGATIVPMHLLLTPEENAFVLQDSGAKLLIAHSSQLENATAAARIAGVKIASVGPPVPGIDRLEEAGEKPLKRYVSREAEDVAVVFYTSGTTGKPKGALLTHLNLVMNTMVNVFDIHDLNDDDIVMGCLPLFHTFGQTVGMNGTFRLGGTIVLMARFTGEAAIQLMVRENVTIFHGVPTMYIGLLEAAAKADTLPQLRLCVSGGASLPVAVLEKFTETFHATIYEGYGLSETSPTATTNQPAFGAKPGTIGHPIWGVEVEIARAEVDERIELLDDGELGEIVIRGHNVFAGYLNNPEATAEAVVDGWFRTGDLGVKDADGFISIVDRKKDLVIRGGFNVYPREVEEALARHPAVQQVAVIGVPDPVHGEEICAVVVPDPGGVTAEELIDWSREKLGKHKYPRQIRFAETLPLGPSFKVLKRELRKTYGSGQQGG